MSVRPRLFGIAYRMLGSAAEAEDVVQDVWVRWQTTDRGVVRDAAAFLATTTTRLAINVMQSARSRRETYVGRWLPEPVDTSADPGLGAERGEGLEAGILLLLEKLSPTERAAYILREAFDYSYRDIANALRLEEANARQVVTRARQHVANGRRMPANSTEQRRLLRAFIAAAQWRRCRPRRSLCVGRCLDLGPSRIGAHCSSGSPNRSDSRFGCAPAARRCVTARLDLALCYRPFPQIVRDPSFPDLGHRVSLAPSWRRLHSRCPRARPGDAGRSATRATTRVRGSGHRCHAQDGGGRGTACCGAPPRPTSRICSAPTCACSTTGSTNARWPSALSPTSPATSISRPSSNCCFCPRASRSRSSTATTGSCLSTARLHMW